MSWLPKNPDLKNDPRYLEPRMNSLDAQLADNTKKITDNAKKTYGKTTKTVKNIVTLYIDDAAPEDMTLVKPITESKGVPVTIAAISNYVKQRQPYSMTIEQLKSLQDAGWEIHSHTVGHVDLNTKTEAQIEAELKDSQAYFESNGITCKSICYPYGNYNDTVMKIARKYYRAGLASVQGVNSTPINTYNTYRLNFDSYDLATLKSKIDAMNNQWAIIYTHSQQWVTDNKVAENTAKLGELIDYIKSKNIEITTVDKALDIFENLLDIGDSSKKFFKVGADGVISQNPVIPAAFSGNNSGITSATPVTSFEKYKTTVTAFLSSENFMTPFTTSVATGGTLLTHRPHSDDGLSFQVFHTSDNLYILKRMWNNGTNNWNAWKVIGGLTGKRQLYIDPVAANGNRVYDFSIVGLRPDAAISATFEGELPTGLVYSVSCPTAGSLRIKIYNVTAAQIPVGVINLFYSQH